MAHGPRPSAPHRVLYAPLVLGHQLRGRVQPVFASTVLQELGHQVQGRRQLRHAITAWRDGGRQ